MVVSLSTPLGALHQHWRLSSQLCDNTESFAAAPETSSDDVVAPTLEQQWGRSSYFVVARSFCRKPWFSFFRAIQLWFQPAYDENHAGSAG